jgi:hypothetical protein
MDDVTTAPQRRMFSPLPMLDFNFSDLDDEALLTEAETAMVIRKRRGTLQQWRRQKDPPHPLGFIKVGHAVRYRVRTIRKYLASL